MRESGLLAWRGSFREVRVRALTEQERITTKETSSFVAQVRGEVVALEWKSQMAEDRLQHCYLAVRG